MKLTAARRWRSVRTARSLIFQVEVSSYVSKASTKTKVTFATELLITLASKQIETPAPAARFG
jgi:hypothetical protein